MSKCVYTQQVEYHKPASGYLDDFSFTPSKIVVDRRGFIYMVTGSEGNWGVLAMDGTGHFRGFFGRTRIKFNLARVLARLLASKAQRRRMRSVRPAPLRNLHLDSSGFIYAVSPILNRDQIQRLNSVGENVYGELDLQVGAGRLWDKLTGQEGQEFGETEVKWRWDERWEMNVPYDISSTFVDVAVDDLGIVSALDGWTLAILSYVNYFTQNQARNAPKPPNIRCF